MKFEKSKDNPYVPDMTSGFKCPKCGIFFEYEKSMLYNCSNKDCPTFTKVTC